MNNHQSGRRVGFFLGVLLFVGSACGGFDPLDALREHADDGSPAASQRMAADEGGALKRSGVIFSVPPQGLSSDTTISIQAASVSSAPATGFASAPVEVGPSGTVFNTAADISFAFDPAQVNVQGLQVVYYDPQASAWQAVPTTVDLENSTASAPLAHLSLYGLADGDASELDLLDNTGDLFARVNSGERGDHLAGAKVVLASSGAASHEALTDDTGTATFTSLPVGAYLLSVSADGHEPAQREIKVEAEAAATIEIVLARTADPLGGVAGQVTAMDPITGLALPIEGAGLALLAPAKPVTSFTAWVDSVLKQNADASWAHPEAVLVAAARTDALGHYAMEKVPAGRYLLIARATGFVTAHALAEVSAGQTTTRDFSLAPIAVPTTGTLYGLVLGKSATGTQPRPIAGALVQAMAADAPDIIVGNAAKTDEHGRYVIPELPAGHYLVAAIAEGYRPGAAKTAIEAGKRTRTDIVLAAEKLVAKGTLAGKLVDANGSGVEGASVVLRSPLADGIVGETDSDAEGYFRFEDLLEGSYVLAAARGDAKSEPVRVKVAAGHTVQVVLKLIPPPATKGALTGLIMSVTVRPADGAGATSGTNTDTGISAVPAHDFPKPIAGAKLRLSSASGELAGETLSNELGAYFFKDLAPGHYLLAVDAGEFGHAARQVKLEAGRTTRADFLLYLKPAPLPATLQGKVSAVIHAGGGLLLQPLAGAKVSVHKPGANDPAGQATTDEQGAYQLEGLSEGAVLVTAEADGFRVFRGTTKLHPGDNTFDIHLQPKPRFGAVAGRVSKLEGKPVAGAKVLLIAPPALLRAGPPAMGSDQTTLTTGTDAHTTLRTAVTDAEGRYAMREVPVGHYTLSVRAAHYATATKEFDVAEGAVAQVDFVLEPAPGRVEGKVYLRVHNAAGQLVPAPGANLTLWRNGEVVAKAETTADGAFVMAGLLPAAYVLAASLPGYLTERRTLTVAAGETTRISIALAEEPGKGSLAVKVSGADGSANAVPLGGATVLVAHAGKVLAEDLTNAEGFVRFEDLPAGEYTVLARKEGYLHAEGIAKVEKAQAATVALLLKGPAAFGSIAGVVGAKLGDQVRPLAGAAVALTPADHLTAGGSASIALPTRSAHTDPEGRFRFDQLLPGAYKLTVELQGYHPARANVLVAAGKLAELRLLLQAVEPPAEEQPPHEEPAHEEPAHEEPAPEEPAHDEPAHEEPAQEEPAHEEPAHEEPAQEEPPHEEPAHEEPAHEEPVAEEPAHEDPVHEEPANEEPAHEEPAAEEPAPEEPAHEEPAHEEPPQEEPAHEEPGTEPAPTVPPAATHGGIAGKVQSYASGGNFAPLAGATVLLRRNGSVLATKTSGDDGSFAFGELEPGDYSVKAEKDGYNPADIAVAVNAGETASANLMLVAVPPPPPAPTTGGLSGIVRSAGLSANTTGEPIHGAALTLTVANNTSGPQPHTAITNADGRYEFKDIPAGHYLLKVTAEQFKAAQAEIDIVAGETASKDLVLVTEPPPPAPTTGGIVGKVQGYTSGTHPALLAGASVLLRRNGSVLATKTSGDDGSFAFGELEPGDYSVKAEKDGYNPADIAVAVKSGETASITLTLIAVRTGGVDGYIYAKPSDPAGSTANMTPLHGATVKVLNANGAVVREAITDDHGQFHFNELPEGSYRVKVSAQGYLAQEKLVQVSATQRAVVQMALETTSDH